MMTALKLRFGLRVAFLLLIAFQNSLVFAQWEPVKENGVREFLHLTTAGNRTLAISLEGKVFTSIDKGQSWQEIDFPINLTGSFSKPEKAYGKAGFLYVSFFTYDGGGVTGQFLLRSNDDGLTWQRIDLNNSYVYNVFAYANGVMVVQESNVIRIRDDDNLPEPILAGGNDKTKFYTSNNRLWRFQGGGTSYSLDDGDTWNFAGPGGFGADLAVKGDTVVVVNDTYGIYRSIDAGVNWVEVYGQATGATFRIHADERGFYRYYYNDNTIDRSLDGFVSWVPMLQSAHNIRQLVLQQGVYIVCTGKGLIRSENDGTDWGLIYNGITPMAEQGDYFLISAQELLCAGRTVFSLDAGDHWSCAPITPPFRSILKKSGSFFGAFDYGGLFKSDGTDVAKWQDVGPMPYQFSDIQIVQQQLICNSQDWLFRSQDEGVSWEQLNYIGGLGTVVSLEDSLFRVGTNGGFYKSEDFGATWTLRGLFPSFIPYITKDYVKAYNGSFYLLNGGGLIVSKNRGKTWTNFPHKFTDPNGNIQFKGFIVNDIGVFVLWNHRIYLSPDDGKHWIDISENLPHHPFGSIAFVNNALLIADYQGNIWRRTDFDFVFNTLLGKVYLDENTNGQYDAQERKIPNIALGTATSQSAAITDVFGDYALFYGMVPDTLRLSVPSPYASINPPFHVLQAGDTLQNFGVQLTPNKQDFSITLTNFSPFVTGFDNTILVRVNNPGTTLSNGALTLSIDNDLQYLSAEPAPTQVNGNTIYWEFGSITPLLWKEMKIYAKTPATVPSGTPIELTASVKEVNNATDLTPANNFVQISTQVVSSFDPNDKQVSPAVYTIDSLAQHVPLDYTVRFQNTGTYQASFVYILDTLAPDLDISTFKLLGSSHPVTVSARYGKVLEFFFQQINLSDSTSNEAGSHGFVRYSVVPKQGLPIGSRVLNTAHIYFDFNIPVITNTVETMLGMVSFSEPRATFPLTISPNPGASRVRIEKNDPRDGLLRVFNPLGQIQFQQATSGTWMALNVEEWPDGVYPLIWISSLQTAYVGSIVVAKH